MLLNRLIKWAAIGGAVTLVTGTTLYYKSQNEMKYAKWFQNALMKVSENEGVHRLIGHPPLTIGDVERHVVSRSELVPKVDIIPEPLYVLRVPLEGKVNKGFILLWLNLLCPSEEASNNIEAWNVGLIEVQIGKSEHNKFVVK